MQKIMNRPPHLPPRGLKRHNSQESLELTRPSALPPKKKLKKQVTLAENELTALGDRVLANKRWGEEMMILLSELFSDDSFCYLKISALMIFAR